MGTIDTGALLEPVGGDSPCGPDLEYSGVMELERIAQGKPERQLGDTVVPAEEPDWAEVCDAALTLAGRTRDLRVLVRLAQALLHTDGLGGLADGLGLIRATVDRFWDCMHPPIDPDDGDPTLRVNTLLGLCDADLMLRTVREAPLVQSRAVGRFSLRDVAIAAGTLPPPEGREPPTAATIDAAFIDAGAVALEALSARVRQAIADAGEIEGLFTDRVGAGAAVSLRPLQSLLQEAGKVLAQQGARWSGGVADASVDAGDAAAPVTAGGGAVGDLRSREDIVRLLDRICEYYRAREPSSPVPLLLERAKRLVYMDFMAIVQDLAPGGMAEVEIIRGTVKEE
jgi:type VI secretion system protein ImpA